MKKNAKDIQRSLFVGNIVSDKRSMNQDLTPDEFLYEAVLLSKLYLRAMHEKWETHADLLNRPTRQKRLADIERQQANYVLVSDTLTNKLWEKYNVQ